MPQPDIGVGGLVQLPSMKLIVNSDVPWLLSFMRMKFILLQLQDLILSPRNGIGINTWQTYVCIIYSFAFAFSVSLILPLTMKCLIKLKAVLQTQISYLASIAILGRNNNIWSFAHIQMVCIKWNCVVALHKNTHFLFRNSHNSHVLCSIPPVSFFFFRWG
jgi:hypothetical protein